MASIDDWRLVSGSLTPGASFAVEVDMSGGGGDTGLIIGGLDRETCFDDATGLNPTPGITKTLSGTIPPDFNGTIVLAYSAFGHCGGGAQGWTGGGLYEVMEIAGVDPADNIAFLDCSFPSGPFSPEELQNTTLPVSVTVRNDNAADLEISPGFLIGGTDFGLTAQRVNGGQTVTMEDLIGPLAIEQVRGIGEPPIEAPIEVGLNRYRVV